LRINHDEFKRARLERRLTRKQLADISGVSYRTIQRLEAGRAPSDSVLIRIAAALDLSPATVQEWFST
jgi:transcriptional regulator with XRE-family HTH domain